MKDILFYAGRCRAHQHKISRRYCRSVTIQYCLATYRYAETAEEYLRYPFVNSVNSINFINYLVRPRL